MLFPRKMAASDFSGRVGKTFTVTAAGHQLPLVLDAYQELPSSGREGGAFRLEFVGPHNPQLGQGMFNFAIGGDSFDIFVVPIRGEAAGIRYEAVFY
jgi:hypothetical protein